MEYNYPKFTPEMKQTHTILIPNMAITQFRLLEYALRYDGYKCEILGNCGSAVAQLGLKYVHNDTCYPALLVIGQFLDALNSGKYDLDHTALLITQTGGGCRASNYIHLLRKALVKAGYPQIPVASLNFSGLEKDSGFQMTLPLARRALACIFYGDMLCALRNQVAPYENEKGAADRMVDLWVERLGRVLLAGKGFTAREMKHTFPLIAKDFAAIPVTRVPKVKVGVVGEIYVKYSPLGNNDLQKFLESQDCEVNFPGLMGLCSTASSIWVRIMSFTAASWPSRWARINCSTGWTAWSVPCSRPQPMPGSTPPGPSRSWWKSPTASFRWGPRWARAGC